MSEDQNLPKGVKSVIYYAMAALLVGIVLAFLFALLIGLNALYQAGLQG